MSVITAYKSDTDGFIFEHFKDYQKHLKTLSKERLEAKKKVHKETSRVDFLKPLYEARNLKEIRQFILDNQEFFIQNSIGVFGKKMSKGDLSKKIVDIQFYTSNPNYKSFPPSKKNGLKWDNKVSNYFSAPAGEKTNWGGFNKNYTTGFPGWKGAVQFITNFECSNILKETGLHISTGNSSDEDNKIVHTYALEVFAQDFKNMAYHDFLTHASLSTANQPITHERISFILENCACYIDLKSKEFKKFMKDIYTSPNYSPSHIAQIEQFAIKPTEIKKRSNLKSL